MYNRLNGTLNLLSFIPTCNLGFSKNLSALHSHICNGILFVAEQQILRNFVTHQRVVLFCQFVLASLLTKIHTKDIELQFVI